MIIQDPPANKSVIGGGNVFKEVSEAKRTARKSTEEDEKKNQDEENNETRRGGRPRASDTEKIEVG